MANEQLQWHTEARRVRDLKPCKNNPNVQTPKQFADLKKSLGESGYVEIIAIDADNSIIAGMHRHQALMELDKEDEMIDVRVPNRKLTKQEFDRYLIASNALGGEWDFSLLKSFDIDLLQDIGLGEDVLSGLWAENLEVEEDKFDEEAELAQIKEPKTKLGDLIALGNHRLLCGDSTDPDSLSYLLGEERASMIYSDPVYNIQIEYNKGIGGKQKYGGNVNDNRTDAEYKEFLRKSMAAALAVTKNDAHVFYWSDQIYIGYVQELYRELGIENKRVCLWVKNSQNPVPSVAFNKCYEPCTYGVRGKPYIAKNLQNLNEVLNKETSTGNALLEEISDLWLVDRLPGKDYEHATSKPPKLHEKAIRRCTKPNDIILDSFGGSGSTLIAADQLKRRAYLVELEPIFCDLIIRRYEKLSGKKAKVISNRYEKA